MKSEWKLWMLLVISKVHTWHFFNIISLKKRSPLRSSCFFCRKKTKTFFFCSDLQVFSSDCEEILLTYPYSYRKYWSTDFSKWSFKWSKAIRSTNSSVWKKSFFYLPWDTLLWRFERPLFEEKIWLINRMSWIVPKKSKIFLQLFCYWILFF